MSLLDIFKRLRWENIIVSLLGVLIMIGFGGAVVAYMGKHNAKSPVATTQTAVTPAPGTKVDESLGWSKVPVKTKNIDQTPKPTAIDPDGNVLDHSKDFMTYYTNSPEGVAVASAFNLLTSTNHKELHTPIQSGDDIAASKQVQDHWVESEYYSTLGGINPSLINCIKELDFLGSSISRVGLLSPISTKPAVDQKGIKYTLTVTSALFKIIEKDGLEHFYVVTLQNQVSKSDSNSNYKLYPTDIQAQEVSRIDSPYNETIQKDYFVE